MGLIADESAYGRDVGEALKAMAQRHGWRQTAAHDGHKLSPKELQMHLCEVILGKLKAGNHVPAEWHLDIAAKRLCGIDTAATEGLSVRQLVEKHRSLPECSGCHERIDPYGFALEAYDAIGRRRDKDSAGHPVDSKSVLRDGTTFEGIDGLRDYLLERRGEDFRRQLCRKLVGYALGRSVGLSDELLLTELGAALRKQDDRFSQVVLILVKSRQFRYHRGSDHMEEER